MLLIVSTANILLALFVLLKNPKREINLVFGILVFSVSIWGFANYFTDFFRTFLPARIAGGIAFAGGSLIAYCLLYFSLIFPNKYKRFTRGIKMLLFIPTIIFIVLSFTNYMVIDLDFLDWGSNPIYGPIHPVFAVYFVVYILLAFVIMVWNYRKTQGIMKAQLRYIILGFAVASIIGTFTNLFWPMITKTAILSRYGPIFTVFIFAFTTYTITRYRLMDIKVVIRKSLIYVCLTAIITLLFILIIYLVSQVFQETYGSNSILIIILMSLVIALGLGPLRKLVDKIFLKEKYKLYRQDINNICKTIRETAKVYDLLHQIAGNIISVLAVKDVRFYVYNKKDKVYEFYYPERKVRKDIRPNDELIVFLSQNRNIYIREENPFLKNGKSLSEKKAIENIKKRLVKDEIEVVIPLGLEEIVGVMLLGPKLSKEAFTKEDTEFLKDLEKPLSWALFNALLYIESMEGFYKAEGKIID